MPDAPAVTQSESPDVPPESSGTEVDPHHRRVTFADLVEAGELPVGSTLVGRRRHKGQPAEEWKAEVQEDGRLLVSGRASRWPQVV